MGLLKKIKKAVKSAVKVAKVTAPLWSSFVPGGSIASTLLSKTGIGGHAGGLSGGEARFPFAKVFGATQTREIPKFNARGVPGSVLRRRSARARGQDRILLHQVGAQTRRRAYAGHYGVKHYGRYRRAS